MNVTVLMEARKFGRTVTDIEATVRKQEPIMKSLLAAHTLSGSDTICHYQDNFVSKQPFIFWILIQRWMKCWWRQHSTCVFAMELEQLCLRKGNF